MPAGDLHDHGIEAMKAVREDPFAGSIGELGREPPKPARAGAKEEQEDQPKSPAFAQICHQIAGNVC